MKGKKNMPTKETRTAWTPFYAESLNGLAIDNGIAMSQLDQFCKDTLNGKLPEEATKDRHPDSVLKALEDAAPAWAKKWCKTSQDQASLFPATTVALDDVPALSGLDDLEKKAADLPKPEITMPEIASNEGVGSTEGAKEASTPTAPPVDVVEAEIVEEPLPALQLPDLEIKEAGQENGKEYAYVANWTRDSKCWQVSLETYVKVWTDEEKRERRNVIDSGLAALRPGDWSFTEKLIDAPVELVNKLRTEADKAIKEAWPELDSKERDSDRIEHLKTAWAGSNGQGTLAALVTFGYNGSKQRVMRYCMKHTQEETEKLNERHEEQSKALTIQSQAVASGTPPALTLLSPNSPIKVPTEAEWRLMERFATFAVRCKIYPNDAAAFLAIYRGFELGFGISTSIENVYAFEGKGGKIMTMPSANAYMAICLNSPLCERFSVMNDTEESAVAIVKRRGNDTAEYKYTKADAQAAGLLGKPAWGSNLKAMLRHRVARSAAELVFADVCSAMGLTGIASDDDLADAGDLPQAAGF